MQENPPGIDGKADVRRDDLLQTIRSHVAAYRERCQARILDDFLYQFVDDSQSGGMELRGIIGIPTRGCANNRNPWHGCAHCGNYASKLIRPAVSENEVLGNFRRSFDMIQKRHDYPFRLLSLFTPGSFLDENEISLSVRSEIVRCVAEAPNIDELIIESVPTFVTEPALQGMLSGLRSDQRLTIGMGFDSINDDVRNLCFLQPSKTEEYKRAVDLCIRMRAKTLAYVVQGAPFLTREQSIHDAATSIKEANDMGYDGVSLEPTAKQPGAYTTYLAERSLYEFPTFSDVASSLAMLPPRCLKNLRVSGQIFSPRAEETLRPCFECQCWAMDALNLPQGFFSELPSPESSHDPQRCGDRTIQQGVPVDRVTLYAQITKTFALLAAATDGTRKEPSPRNDGLRQV